MCVVFSDHAKSLGWRVFPETSGWDLLLVATDGVQTVGAVSGDQIGIQAKLRGNLLVLDQARPKRYGDKGPHYHAVLVPEARPEFSSIANDLGILVFIGTKQKFSFTTKTGCIPVPGMGIELARVPVSKKFYYSEPEWHPDVEIWTPPGVRSPQRITPWKIKAVRLCLESESRGYVLSSHFRASGVSMQRWLQNGWIKPAGERVGRSKKYVLDLGALPPHLAYPEISEVLRRDTINAKSSESRVSAPTTKTRSKRSIRV